MPMCLTPTAYCSTLSEEEKYQKGRWEIKPGPTISAVHVGTTKLVDEEHENKAQDQRHPDVGMQLLVTV